MTVKGLITAMVTPMRNGSIDEEAVRGLVERLIQKGVNGIFILGTNGEFHVLSREEKVKLAAMVVEYADCRVPVYAGSGGNSTQEVIELSGFATDGYYCTQCNYTVSCTAEPAGAITAL